MTARGFIDFRNTVAGFAQEVRVDFSTFFMKAQSYLSDYLEYQFMISKAKLWKIAVDETRSFILDVLAPFISLRRWLRDRNGKL